LAQQVIAIAGVSRKPAKFGNTLYKELRKKGISLIPVHPELQNFEGEKCYSSVEELPSNVTALLVCTKPEKAVEIVESALKRGITNIWLQQGSENPHLLLLAQNEENNIITGHCMLMFAKPDGMHKFHRFLLKLFGKYPS
jgi:hypothetical protein